MLLGRFETHCVVLAFLQLKPFLSQPPGLYTLNKACHPPKKKRASQDRSLDPKVAPGRAEPGASSFAEK